MSIAAIRRPGPTWTTVAVAALAAATTMGTLGRQSFSWSEAVTVSVAQRSYPNLRGLLAHTDAPVGLYYVMMHGWLAALRGLDLPVTEVSVRLPSAAATVISTVLVVRLLRRWYGFRVGALAGTLFALYPLVTFYAQDARPYALVTMLFLLSIDALLRATARPTVIGFAVYAGLVTITLYLHLLVLPAVLAQGLLVTGRTRRQWLACVGVALAAAAPLAVTSSRQTAEIGWIPHESLTTVASALSRIAGGVAFTAVVVSIIIVLLARRRITLRVNRSTRFLIAWATLPPTALVVAGFIAPDLVPRYALVIAPALSGLAALGISRVGGRSGRALAVAAVVAALTTTLVQQTRPYKYEDYRAAVDEIGDRARPGDAVLFLPVSTRVGFEIYRQLDPDEHPVADPTLAPHGQPDASTQIGGVERQPAEVASAFRSVGAVFVLSDRADLSQRPADPLTRSEIGVLAHYRLATHHDYGGLFLSVYHRR